MSGPTDMPSARANRIADAVEDIVLNVSRLRELQGLTREEYKAEGEQDRRDSVERKFEKVTAATLDIAEEIVKQERGTAPTHRKQLITELESDGILDSELADRLREAVGFRDVLAHSYGPVVNDDIVYDALQRSLDRYREFVEAINHYLSD